MATNIKQIHGKVLKSFSTNKQETTALLAHAKLALIEAGLLVPVGEHHEQELIYARDILEIGAFWSIRVKDVPSFDRYFSQLQTFYSDYDGAIRPSDRKYALTGLNLIRLLTQNRISDFHTILESLPPETLQENKFIRHPVNLERWLMEGSYSKVWNAREEAPATEYKIFVDSLMGTIRNEIASCEEAAYSSLPMKDAETLLFFHNQHELMAFTQKRGWQPDLIRHVFTFPSKADDKNAEIPTRKIISQALTCAKELEQIFFLPENGFRHMRQTPSSDPGMHLYLREQPVRTLLLTTSSEDERKGCPRRALIFRAEGIKAASQATVEFVPKDEVDFTGLVRLTARQVHGCLGLINIANDIYLGVVTSATSIGNLRPGAHQPEEVHRIQEVAFFGLNTALYDDLGAAEGALPSPVHLDSADSVMKEYSYSQSQAQPSIYEHPASAITNLFTSGTFYFAPAPVWDISSRLSERIRKNQEIGDPFSSFDERFVWNEFVVKSLLDFREGLDSFEREDLDKCQFIILAIQGYVGMYTVTLPRRSTDGGPVIATVGLISRLSWKRAGTRFNARGVDDDGHVANSVETETIFSTDATCMSYVQIRGSVPLFWEQQGLQTFRPTVQITRSQAASQPAFDRHFSQLAEEYGAIHAINLLGTRENEATLTEAYSAHLRALQATGSVDVGITHYDFHNHVKLTGHESVVEIRRIPSVRSSRDKFGLTTMDASTDSVITAQHGVFRTNCLDCLDRTNFVQDILSRTALEDYFMQVRPEWRQSAGLWGIHRELWAENGDALSKIYAGTGALNTSFTRTGKRTLAGVLADATKSVSRAYINNFQDKAKQIAIDLFLGNLAQQKPVSIFNPIHDTVRLALFERLREYSTTRHISIFAGTWNLNGRTSSESLLPWLFPKHDSQEPDLFVIGFQEIVPLTAQQILQTDPEQKRRWERILVETLARRPNRKADYTILRSEQLVGTALIIIVRSDITSNIRKVEAATRKTGLRGISGNKGAVGIRLEYHDTSFCFLTAHLAAGHTNVEERNHDYQTIIAGLHFLKGKTIGSHDNVVWVADANYRIDLENEVVRHLATNDEIDMLVAADQLGAAMASGAAFVGYEEGPILFRPTYRYNLNSDEYDTSEKMRIPAWTDRILYRGNSLDLEKYSRAELKSSDHRPVYALFRAEVRIVDYAKKNAIQKSLLQMISSTAPNEKLEDKLKSMNIPDTSNLPPPSSGAASDWWNGPGHPNGVFDLGDYDLDDSNGIQTNPWDSPRGSRPSSLHSSPSPSDDELYKNAVTASKNSSKSTKPVKKAPPPPPPSRATKPSAIVPTSTDEP